MTPPWRDHPELADYVATGLPNLLGLKNNKRNQNMTKLQIKISVIGAVLVIVLYFLFPTIQWYSMSQDEKDNREKSRDKILNKIIPLGLDLRGGTHLLLEIDDTKLMKDEKISNALDRTKEVIRNRIDQYGVTEPLIAQQGEKWIVVQLPGIKDPERAKELIGKTALLEFRLVDLKERFTNIAQKVREMNLEFDSILTSSSVLKLVPTGYVLLPGKDKSGFYLAKSSPEITGGYLVDARVETGGEFGMPYVGLEFNRDGANMFARITEANIGNNLAIVLDGVVQSAPVIRSRIPDGKAIIEGRFSDEEAKFLANVLRSGALPVPVSIIEERTVGPSLGRDSINAGIKSSIIGFLLVVVFMIFYYRIPGVISDIALLMNFIILCGALAMFHATLTLPGIAGIILTLGMAVDANVLILERIRDELGLNKTVRVAIDLGYSRALSAIIDSNITTLIAALFLFQFGTGPIKGFAVTLSLGILISMFTAIFVTKVSYEYLFDKKILKTLNLKP
ncbi:MAG: protein-export membrane protein SecD [Elusimicrobia bacterium CG1_02_37_114]|nr:MAG: protein-export membrane protein SecD [Elusimicrobia bacterium CG1_02_37_114]